MPPLSRERLQRLLIIIARQGGAETVRQLARRFSIWPWEIEAAERLGWVKIETRRPRTGRPSRIVRRRDLSESPAAKLPPPRSELGRRISRRHWLFAMRSALCAADRGIPSFGIPPTVEAYRSVYATAQSRAGAAASASRLMKHPHVRAARQWFYAKRDRTIPEGEAPPSTAREIWQRLRELGSWRVET